MRITLAAPLLACACGALSLDDGSGSDSGFPTFSTSTWDEGAAAFEDQVLELVNRERASGGRCGTTNLPSSDPLEEDLLLQALARDYSRWMAEDQFFDHVDPNGDDPFDRFDHAGFDGDEPWGENIAAGYATPREVVAGWMSSPGHCLNILEPTFRVMGVGYFRRDDDPSLLVHYWTQEFAGSH